MTKAKTSVLQEWEFGIGLKAKKKRAYAFYLHQPNKVITQTAVFASNIKNKQTNFKLKNK